MSSKRRLLVLHHAAVFGGAERTTANLLAHLDRSRVERITLATSGAIRVQFSHYDHFIDLDPYQLSPWFSDWRRLIADARKVAGILRQESPDVVLAVMHYSAALVVFAGLLFGSRARRIISLRGPLYEHMRHYETDWKRRLFLRSACTLMVRAADRIIVPSRGTKQELADRFFARAQAVTVISNGIDCEAVDRQRAEPIAETDLFRDRPILCSIARLAVEKNLGLLLEAFALISQQSECGLILLGSGPERERLEQRVAELGLADRVRLLGEKTNVFAYLRLATVFIHTCMYEGFGYTMLEAMACGVPVVATNCPYGPGEVLDEGRYGILAPMHDPAGLAECVLSLLRDENRRAELARAGRQRAEALSIRQIMKEYEQVLLDEPVGRHGIKPD